MDQPSRPPSVAPTPAKPSRLNPLPQRRRQRRYDPLAVLDAIDTYQRSHNRRSPSQRWLQSDLTISAPSVVHMILHRLQNADLLRITTYGRGLSADLTLTEAGQDVLRNWRNKRR
jgi:Mn-dependent DtxR family transcriptional regulator